MLGEQEIANRQFLTAKNISQGFHIPKDSIVRKNERYLTIKGKSCLIKGYKKIK